MDNRSFDRMYGTEYRNSTSANKDSLRKKLAIYTNGQCPIGILKKSNLEQHHQKLNF